MELGSSNSCCTGPDLRMQSGRLELTSIKCITRPFIVWPGEIATLIKSVIFYLSFEMMINYNSIKVPIPISSTSITIEFTNY